jgi:hypothetical protein
MSFAVFGSGVVQTLSGELYAAQENFSVMFFLFHYAFWPCRGDGDNHFN